MAVSFRWRPAQVPWCCEGNIRHVFGVGGGQTAAGRSRDAGRPAALIGCSGATGLAALLLAVLCRCVADVSYTR